ncbi:MAG: phosphatase PAP2 family protein [Prolixibacteraceae bacterium]
MELKETVFRIFRSSIFVFLIVLCSNQLNAEEKRDTLITRIKRDTVRIEKAQVYDLKPDQTRLYFRPKPFQFAKNVPTDIFQMGKTAFSKKNLPKLGLILAGTALLLTVDQPISDAAQQFGRYINLDPARKSKTLIEFDLGNFHVNAMEIPDNLNSTFYYLGEGWGSMLFAGGFYSYGLITNDYRARQTASQITESIFALGFTTQFLKRITGRQSPFRANIPGGVPGGAWHPFPAPGKYQKSVSNYDAFPSGHLATAMATITIIAGNFPDSKFVKPVGYSLMGLLAYSMLNNEVHWISDYPLAIAIGYTCGKIAVSHGHQIIPKIGKTHGSTSSILPAYLGEGNFGMSYRAIF